jgi:hypothetical protein
MAEVIQQLGREKVLRGLPIVWKPQAVSEDVVRSQGDVALGADKHRSTVSVQKGS